MGSAITAATRARADSNVAVGMMDGLRKFLQSKAGFVVAGVTLVIAVLAIFVAIKNTFGDSDAEALANRRDFIDATTGKPFKASIGPDTAIPVKAPSGGMSGYPAEKCFWTKDGKIKDEPTLVLINTWTGKAGPTFCPDCGRLVVGHNPLPRPGMKPPPTKEEYPRNRGRVEER